MKKFFCHCMYSPVVHDYLTTSPKAAAVKFAADNFTESVEGDCPEIVWVVEQKTKKRSMFAVVLDLGEWKAAEFK